MQEGTGAVFWGVDRVVENRDVCRGAKVLTVVGHYSRVTFGSTSSANFGPGVSCNAVE